MQDKLIGIKEAAELLNVSQDTFDRKEPNRDNRTDNLVSGTDQRAGTPGLRAAGQPLHRDPPAGIVLLAGARDLLL